MPNKVNGGHPPALRLLVSLVGADGAVVRVVPVGWTRALRAALDCFLGAAEEYEVWFRVQHGYLSF